MYLLDTNIISELRKRDRANPGIIRFFDRLTEQEAISYLSVITIGELRRGVDIIQHRGDFAQAKSLENWLQTILDSYAENILDFGREEAQIWGRLRVPHPENALDKQIAATALVYDLTLVTRNVKDFVATGVTLLNPFE
ncbi:type II toxin-antitoxin system VapC family toxin [Chamaesiphon sp. VAR_69_metabat_338]|uniref:type II toxin-antitoxin system VapC family toxin n=1 Tax=Chamaesiphon sp. VAR_69_metabat_338 TaxID=2964704 RepID=UPI00286D7FAC|nr:type II toxin-antitoxin system VapC family toxin [Chamaesiphon sp. VAR_69_metabat_338]